jgi:RND family efflux transporter MFP subunit
VRAPFAGTLGRVLARPGERVTAGGALATLRGGTGTLWAEVRVPERDAVGLHAGAEASIVTTATPDTPRDAVVLDPGQQVDPATGTVTVTLALPDAGPSLPGGGVTAWITHGTPRETLVVPSTAVLEHDGTPFVFVKTAPESFAARPVRLGARSGTSWEVLGGVAPGERVVTAGSGPLRALAGR